MPKNKNCQFKTDLVKDYTCSELPLEGSNYCIFHKPNKTEEEAELFQKKIKEKLRDKDYVFIGYHFPTGTTFGNQRFEKNAYFRESTFEGDADFRKSIFEEGAYFGESPFRGDTFFGGSIFKGHAYFWKSTFGRYVSFGKSTFEEDADFGKSTFEEGADFEESIFKKDADFEESIFKIYADFEGSTFDTSPNFINTTFRHISSAEKVFRIAKTCSQKEGDYSLAGEYYYKERIAKRKQLPLLSPKRWFEYILLDALCGYGERPLRAVRTGLGVLFGLAFLYWKVGHIYPSPELFNEPHTLTFWDALYFSVVTFTTLGFGDWRPDPSHWIRYIVMSEAFIGAFLMALFIVTFARRMMR